MVAWGHRQCGNFNNRASIFGTNYNYNYIRTTQHSTASWNQGVQSRTTWVFFHVTNENIVHVSQVFLHASGVSVFRTIWKRAPEQEEELVPIKEWAGYIPSIHFHIQRIEPKIQKNTRNQVRFSVALKNMLVKGIEDDFDKKAGRIQEMFYKEVVGILIQVKNLQEPKTQKDKLITS
jgi:hypothetical protein